MIPKKSLFKISFNHYLKHKIQSILLILGISLGVAVIVAIDIANINARKSFDKSLRSISGKTTHNIYSSTAGLSEDLYFSLRKILGYKNIIPIIEEPVYLKQFPAQQFKIIGIDPFSENSLLSFFGSHDIRLDSRSFELFLTEPNGAIISDQLLSKLDLQDYTRAIDDFDKILSHDRNHFDALCGKAAALFQLENNHDALTTLEKLGQKINDDILVMNLLSVINEKLNNLDVAIDYCNKMINKHSESQQQRVINNCN